MTNFAEVFSAVHTSLRQRLLDQFKTVVRAASDNLKKNSKTSEKLLNGHVNGTHKPELFDTNATLDNLGC